MRSNNYSYEDGASVKKEVNPIIAWSIIIFFISVFITVFLFRVQIKDWWYFRSYVPSNQIEKLTLEAGLSEEGKKLFYRSDPELVSEVVLEQECGNSQNLGCIVSGPKIYINDFDDYFSRYYFQSSVTSAHEMLHLAYFRLSDSERTDVDNMVTEAIELVRDKDVLDRIRAYPQDEQADEAHSIIGTEVDELPNRLDVHYTKYFSDRTKVYSAFDQSRSLID